MEITILDVNWAAVVVGAVVAYVFGSLWFSNKMFAKAWKEGLGSPAVPNTPMTYGMLSQAFGTFLLSWTIGVTHAYGSFPFAVLVTITIVSLIKANGFFAGKKIGSIAIESTFVITMVVLMLIVHSFFN